MSAPPGRTTGLPGRPFRHEALLYAGTDDFVEKTSAFVSEAVDAGEPVLVVVSDEKISRLRSALGPRSQGISFADMSEVGANPARIMPVWYDFVAERSGDGRVRGVGEPIDATRSPEALVECQRHESLLNLAFADVCDFWLVCPYDTSSLAPEVIDEAFASHPHVVQDGTTRDSATYRDVAAITGRFDLPLAEAPPSADRLDFDIDRLDELRELVVRRATEAGLSRARTVDLVLAVHEAATNSIRHGGGSGTLIIWRQEGRLTCEVRDAGLVDEPLAGRRRPTPVQDGGFGMWLVHQLCDLTQVRSFEDGTAVRMHMWTR